MTNTDPAAGRRPRATRLSVIALAALAGVWAALFAGPSAAAASAETGQRLFQEKCTACHTVGGGPLVGPDLKGVTERRPLAWLQQWIAAPDRMLALADPVATALLHQFHGVPMPNLHLGASEIADLLAYLATTGGHAPAAASEGSTAAARTPAPTGDPGVGRELFIGAARFHNGGPPCMACHSVAGIGALGGGQLGPDLTTVVARYGGAAAVSAFVGGSPTPTMNAVWQRTPLTPGERADVVAFLAQASIAERPVEAIWQLAGLSVLGVAILLALAGWIWRKRSRGVRRPMLAHRRHARGHAGRP